MTDVQKRFVELDKKKEEIIKFYEEYEKALMDLHDEIGVNGHFIDDEKIVYKLIIPTWKNIKMEHLSCVRTKRSHEKKGTLSVANAKELGYDI